MESLKWYFQLVDQLSGPARVMRLQLQELRRAFGEAGRAGADAAASALEAGGAFGGAAGAAAIAVNALKDLARASAGVALETAKFAVESASFKRNTMAGFTLIEGSAEEAKKVFDQIKSLADKTPFETKDVLRLFGSLRGSGFKVREAQDLLAGAFDVGSVIGGSEGRDVSARLVEGIVKIRSEGRLTADVIKEMALASAGKLNLGSFYEQLAVLKKISVEQAKQQTSKGEIGAGEGLTAILKTIQADVDKGGPLGKATEVFGVLSWEGQLSTFKSRLASIFENIKIQPLVDAMTRVNDLLSDSSPTGKRIRAFFNNAFGNAFATVGRLLDSGTLTKVFDGIANAVDNVGDVFGVVWPYVLVFADAFGQTLKPVVAAIGPLLGKLFGDIKSGAGPSPTVIKVIQLVAEGLAQVVIVLGAVLAIATAVGGALLAFQAALTAVALAGVNLLVTGLGALWDALSELVVGAWNAATAFVDGLVNGITSGWRRVTDTVKGLARGAVNAVESVLGISSPSKVMAKMGAYTAEGFSVGVRGATPMVAQSFDAMVAPSDASSFRLPPPTPAMSLGSSSSGSSMSVTVEVGPIQIHGVPANDVEGLATALETALERRMVDVFERLALEQGGTAA